MQGKVLGVPLVLVLMVTVILVPLLMVGAMNYRETKKVTTRINQIETTLSQSPVPSPTPLLMLSPEPTAKVSKPVPATSSATLGE